jgi:hypothetical protein
MARKRTQPVTQTLLTRPCDIEVTPAMKALFFDYEIRPRSFYWTIHGKVLLTIWGRDDAVYADTPLQAINEAGQNGGL